MLELSILFDSLLVLILVLCDNAKIEEDSIFGGGHSRYRGRYTRLRGGCNTM